MRQEDLKIYNEIEKILWNDWDPIGVNDNESARDEYYSYIPEIFKLKKTGADKEVIAKRLDEIATKEMGLFSNIEHSRKIADKIISLTQ